MTEVPSRYLGTPVPISNEERSRRKKETLHARRCLRLVQVRQQAQQQARAQSRTYVNTQAQLRHQVYQKAQVNPRSYEIKTQHLTRYNPNVLVLDSIQCRKSHSCLHILCCLSTGTPGHWIGTPTRPGVFRSRLERASGPKSTTDTTIRGRAKTISVGREPSQVRRTRESSGFPFSDSGSGTTTSLVSRGLGPASRSSAVCTRKEAEPGGSTR